MATVSKDAPTPKDAGYKSVSAAMNVGANEERKRIIKKIREKGYDWSHDKNASGLQNLLTWLETGQE